MKIIFLKIKYFLILHKIFYLIKLRILNPSLFFKILYIFLLYKSNSYDIEFHNFEYISQLL